MPFKKIAPVESWMTPTCRDPEHFPPRMIVLEPGKYKYTCPACGATRSA